MNLRNILFIFSAFFACLLVASCMTPGQQVAALSALDELNKSDALTPEQFEDLRRSIVEAGSANFWQQIGSVATSVALSYVGVRVDRGAPERVRARRK